MGTFTPPVVRDERCVGLYRLTMAVGAVTVGAGLVQLVAPGFVLRMLDAESTVATRQLFAIVGMFMAVVGAALLHGLRVQRERDVILLWAGVQKVAAAALVALAVSSHVFSGLALAVALNDFASSLVIFRYRSRLVSA